MAKKSAKDEQFNYASELRTLKERRPERLYLLWGPEDYLREQYLTQLKKKCLPEGEDDFSYKRLDGPALDPLRLQQALDAMPFMTERTFIELRDVDINKLSDAESCAKLISDIPDYCTVAFVQNAQFEPDGRLRFVKTLRSECRELKFTQQSQGMLTDWIARRFAAAGKKVELSAAQRLIFISGDLMSRLIPEIEKIAAYAKGDVVTQADVEAVANHIPEAVVFEMTEQLAQGDRNGAMATLAELLAMKDAEPIAILAAVGGQMRRLYAAKVCEQNRVGTQDAMALCDVRYDFLVQKLQRSARRFSMAALERSVALCAETDYDMKHSGADNLVLLEDCILKIMMEAAR